MTLRECPIGVRLFLAEIMMPSSMSVNRDRPLQMRYFPVAGRMGIVSPSGAGPLASSTSCASWKWGCNRSEPRRSLKSGHTLSLQNRPSGVSVRRLPTGESSSAESMLARNLRRDRLVLFSPAAFGRAVSAPSADSLVSGFSFLVPEVLKISEHSL